MKARLARLVACALPHLAILAVMLLALSPEARVFWQCQGQTCGATAWTCCCNSQSSGSNCAQECGSPNSFSRSASLENVQAVGDSTQGCHCTMVAQDAPKSLPSQGTLWAAPIFFVSVLPLAFYFEAPREVARLLPRESRGPPPTICLSSPSLRGPPYT